MRLLDCCCLIKILKESFRIRNLSIDLVNATLLRILKPNRVIKRRVLWLLDVRLCNCLWTHFPCHFARVSTLGPAYNEYPVITRQFSLHHSLSKSTTRTINTLQYNERTYLIQIIEGNVIKFICNEHLLTTSSFLAYISLLIISGTQCTPCMRDPV